MKAVIWTAYGPPEVLQLQDIPKPEPKDNEILIRIRAASVTAGDCEQRGLRLPFLLGLAIRIYAGLIRPSRIKILGFDLSGEVESVGSKVSTFKRGDQVLGTTGFTRMGTYAEYISLPTDSADTILVKKPKEVDWEAAAGVPTGGLEARYFTEKASITKDMKVLIIGAAGTIGGFLTQLVKLKGAEITAVDAAGKLDMLHELGADETLDYRIEKVFDRKERYDVVIDIAGKSSIFKTLKPVKKNGRCVLVNPSISQKMFSWLIAGLAGKKIVATSSKQTPEGLQNLTDLLKEGKLKSWIDRSFPLEEAVNAHKYVESGNKTGNVVFTMKKGD